MASAASSASFGARAIAGACLAVAMVMLQCACPVASQSSAVLGKTSATMALGLMERTADSAATPAPAPVSPSAAPAGGGPIPTMAASGGRSGLDLTNRPPPVSASAPPGKNPRTPAAEAAPPAAATPTAQAAAQPVRPPPAPDHGGCSRCCCSGKRACIHGYRLGLMSLRRYWQYYSAPRSPSLVVIDFCQFHLQARSKGRPDSRY